MSASILLVEDEPGLRFAVSDLFRIEGYEVTAAADGNEGYAQALTGRFDLIILDLMMPGCNGLAICSGLRQQGRDIPILMLTAKTQVVDRVVGLKMGADDYLAKPFDPAELVARVEALLRRSSKIQRVPLESFEFGGTCVNFQKGEVTRHGTRISLAAKELKLLHYLVERRGVTVSRDELLGSVWAYHSDVSSRTVDVHIAWLRQKVEDTPQRPRFIHTVRGTGYRFSNSN